MSRALEAWIIATLARFNVTGERREDRIGVWVRRPEKPPLPDGRPAEDKIAAIGIRVRRWVTFHGISLNVDPDLEHYSGIVPCGVTGLRRDQPRRSRHSGIDGGSRRGAEGGVRAAVRSDRDGRLDVADRPKLRRTDGRRRRQDWPVRPRGDRARLRDGLHRRHRRHDRAARHPEGLRRDVPGTAVDRRTPTR